MYSNEELYVFIDELIAKLESLNDVEWSERLRNAMYISSVGTEVFMVLRKELTEFFRSDIDLDDSTRANVLEAITYIGRALR